ncbi:MAG: ECF transporter S component [Thaumarchaeota archaeon]|nr:ECF transporter S component [Candidatus Calditenuaceae archaeon]MDW8042078.1 ECF transporter S component [Nitrososphaerota archaeon]
MADGRFTTRDVVGLASFSALAGVVFAAWSQLAVLIVYPLLGHLGTASIYGLWFMGGTLPAYVIRKRWVAFAGETVASVVELLLVSPYSVLLYYYGPAQGIMSELAFALGRYKRWGWGTMALAGALPVIAAYPFDCLVSPFYPACRTYPLWLHLSIVSAMIISGVLLSGLLVKSVVDRLVEAGSMRGWAVAEARAVQAEAGRRGRA